MNLNIEWSVIWTTLQLALTVTSVLLILGTPLAWWLATTRHWSKALIESIVSLPLVLPPTVLGFYMLLMLGPNGWLGQLAQWMVGHHLAFTFTGISIGAALASIPFVVQPLQNAFAAIGTRPLEVAATLRANPLDCFFTIVLPLARNGFLTAATLCFTHTIGEFGVILMIGGGIPNKTEVMSIAIYEHVEMMEFREAHFLAGSMLLFSFIVLLTLYSLNKHKH